MMSMFLTAVLSFSWAQSDVRCANEAEQYVGVGYSRGAQFEGQAPNGEMIFHVRVNDNGGDAAYEVIVASEDCSLISKRLLWTE